VVNRRARVVEPVASLGALSLAEVVAALATRGPVVVELHRSPLEVVAVGCSSRRVGLHVLERCYSPSSSARSLASWASSASEYGGGGQHGWSDPGRSEQSGMPSILQTRCWLRQLSVAAARA
jgi:hypothetical protein